MYKASHLYCSFETSYFLLALKSWILRYLFPSCSFYLLRYVSVHVSKVIRRLFTFLSGSSGERSRHSWQLGLSRMFFVSVSFVSHFEKSSLQPYNHSDTVSNRSLTGIFLPMPNATIEVCVNDCQSRNFTFSGLEWSTECVSALHIYLSTAGSYGLTSCSVSVICSSAFYSWNL